MVQRTLVVISHTQGMRTHPAGQSFVEGAEEAVNSVDGAKAFHIGLDAGSRVPSDPRSYTELEFDGATELRRERLVLLLRPDSAYLEGVDPRRVAPERARFRHRLETSGATVACFDDVGDLKYTVRQAVEQYATDVPPGDQERFSGVQVGQRSTVRLLLGVSASSPVTDRVRVVVPGVRGAGGPSTRCRITVPPVKVTISPGT